MKSDEIFAYKDMEKFNISQAEFKGKVLQSLEDIRSDINELKEESRSIITLVYANKTSIDKAACKEDIKDLQAQVNGLKIISSVLGAVGGFFTSIASLFLNKG